MSFLDRELEALYRDLSWDRETLMVVVSDHGEEFMEHGRIGHHFTLYNELMRVLVAFSSSALEIPSQLRERPNVSLVDVAPTILDLIGVPIPKPSDGRSMSSLVLATESSPTEVKDDRVLFGHRSYHRVRAGLPERHLWAAVQGPWKFIDSDLGESLFHLEDDPRERVNRIAEEPEIANRLRHRLRRLQAEGFRSGESTEVEIDEETRRRLEALGYVQ
jgi:arylsulfatase A-like enzyme